jgi:dolichol-phosphate mannosyltransferase
MIAGATAIARLARAARRSPSVTIGPESSLTDGLRPKVGPGAAGSAGSASDPAAAGSGEVVVGAPGITVVIPARDEVARIEPCLRAAVGAPGVAEVIVVDDRSTDGTAALATRLGARVVNGATLPAGWVGKPWALQQGLDAARTDWVMTLDADTEPDPALPAALVARATADRWDLLTVGGRFVLPTAGLQALHPAMLATLVYRFGPPGGTRPPRPERTIANGQCTVFRRQALVDAGGFTGAAGHLTDDIALARHLAGLGWRVGFLDASTLVRVRMHEGFMDAWRNWGRSLPMPDMTTPVWQAADLAVVWLAQALPLPRLLTGRGDVLDVVLAAARVGTHAGTASAYEREARTVWWWLAPLLDVPVAARLTQAALRPERTWRGRTY